MTENNMPNGNNSSDEMQQVVREDVPAVDNEKENAGSEEPAVVLAMPDHPKKRGVSVFACIIITLACCLVTFMATFVLLSSRYSNVFKEYAAAVNGGDFSQSLMTKISAIDSVMRDEYLYDIDDSELSASVLQGYMDGLGDRYADYYTADEFAALMEDTNGEMQGIGISIVNDTDNHALQIIAVFPDSPALEAGLRPGDRIAYVKIDGEYVSVAELGYQAAVSNMQGKADTMAEFIAYSEGNFDNPREYSIKRGYVTERTVESRICALDKTVGIIRITSFDRGTPEQFNEAVEAMLDAGAEKLVFDVRNNPGGDLDSVCSVLDTLLPEGTVVRTVDKNGSEEIVYTSDRNEIDVPMAVVANGNTASAGELFTAALRDYDKAVIVGEKTFGKGSMQTIRSFTDGTGFKFTYRYYCPPVSDNYDGVGIEPDIASSLSEVSAAKNIYTLEDSEDDQLAAAVDALNKK